MEKKYSDLIDKLTTMSKSLDDIVPIAKYSFGYGGPRVCTFSKKECDVKAEKKLLR